MSEVQTAYKVQTRVVEPRADLQARLLALMPRDDVMVIIDALSEAQERAEVRGCEQLVEFVFDPHGHLRHVNQMDRRKVEKPEGQ